MFLIHPISPVYDKESKVLVLGSFPSVKSREVKFFYGHPQNRFWKVLSTITGEPVPSSIEEKKSFLLRNHIAVWDVASSCEIEGSSDSSIRNVTPNDISRILDTADIKRIYANGKTAWKMYEKYLKEVTGRECSCLPSTSPANAAYSVERLSEEWKDMVRFVKEFKNG
ncbi:MAG: DNA-deoxyinosine glycosylase [Lachnospiraceae bacterium]|nr:DNA-deoxyinosine glycosylase [Lachnospiraceae bacterium]